MFFNLIDEPFIKTSDGLYSITGLFENAHKIKEIQCNSPLENFAIHRFLLPIIYRSYGVEDRTSWKKLWGTKQFGTEVKNYLAIWHDRFYLSHPEYPFMQDSKVTGKEQSINKLEFITDNDSSLFNKNFIGSKKETASTIAIKLIAYQLMSLNSGKGITEKRSNFHAAARRGIGILLMGKNVFETLLLNCPPLDRKRLPVVDSSGDSPSWEQDSCSTVVVKGYMHYLTQPARKTKLMFDGDSLCVSAISEKANNPAENVYDPFVMYEQNKKGEFNPIRFEQTEFLWKHFKSLVISLKQDAGNVIFTNNANLSLIDDEISFSYCCFGMNMDSKLTKFKYISENYLPMRVSAVKDESLSLSIEKCVEESERVGKLLSGKLYYFYKGFGGSNEKWMYQFWSEINNYFSSFMSDFYSGDKEACNIFVKSVKREACKIFQEAISRVSETNMPKYIEFMYQENNLSSFYKSVWKKENSNV